MTLMNIPNLFNGQFNEKFPQTNGHKNRKKEKKYFMNHHKHGESHSSIYIKF